MNNFDAPNGFLDFLSEIPLFFKIFGGLVFTLVVGGFLFVIIRGLKIWLSNNASEIITQKCKVVDKRTEVWGGSGDSSANTNYYITFEFEDHTRKELYVSAKHFGLIVIGDQGELTYQGTRFKEFSRLADSLRLK
ncbi:DUF2500 domain-containing protein [Paenibacillus sediminis]|uniref:DUF2500 domain-containing protein n=1 Tax=Paenibacillus sediminis TaxID=664909 RepID=A0ABS4H1Y2_9BACL|nr:DUF2500 domain-containing protein [Paenibacillus sediminis]MBP1936542.1 hypothetical protein [Paenibacillus sediminis]